MFVRLPLFFSLLCSLCSCSLFGIKEDLSAAESIGYVQGQVQVKTVDAELDTADVYAALLSYKGDQVMVLDQVQVDKKGQYRFYLFEHDYYIGAYVDANHNRTYDEGEITSYYGAPDAPAAVRLDGHKSIHLPHIMIDDAVSFENTGSVDQASSLRFWRNSENIGQLISWSSPFLTDEYAKLGMWQPLRFVTTVEQAGLMMLQEYSPNKIPVLFIHGMTGSPRDWQTTIEHLDTERYQAWVVYYPSGIRLDMISDYLVYALSVMEQRYDFAQFSIAAHSMGGLVARSLIKKIEHSTLDVHLDCLVTVNSPLLGLDSALAGVTRSPLVVPAWRDVATGSEFIHHLQEWDLPKTLNYHLAFSYGGEGGSDGVVSIASQIPIKQQQEAKTMRGFDSQHSALLHEPEFIRWFNQVLD